MVSVTVRGDFRNRVLRLMPRYLKYTLDQYVESDYTVVYFHYGLNSRNKPSLGWLQSAYKEFDRRCVRPSPGGRRRGRGSGSHCGRGGQGTRRGPGCATGGGKLG